MKIGNIYRYDDNIVLILNYCEIGDVYKISFKILNTGIMKTEMLKKSFFLDKESMNLNYVRETKDTVTILSGNSRLTDDNKNVVYDKQGNEIYCVTVKVYRRDENTWVGIARPNYSD